MTAPDFPDFTQSVAVIDRSAVLIAQTIVLDGGTIPSVDTSQWQSVTIVLQPVDSGSIYNSLATAAWNESGNSVAVDKCLFNVNVAQSQLPSLYLWQLPARGSTLFITINTQAPNGVQVTVYGYSRTTPEPKLARVGVNNPTAVLDTGNRVVAAGATDSAFYIPPTTKGFWINSTSALAKTRVNVVLSSHDDLLGWSGVNVATIAGDGSVYPNRVIPVGFAGGFVQLHNDDTVAHTWACQVWELT